MKPVAKTVLIADDDQVWVSALAVRCSHIGLIVKTAHEGREALKMVDEEPPDLAILDVNMPSGSGLAVCEMLAARERLTPLPVIMLTGRTDEGTIRRCQELGAHYLAKSGDLWERLQPLVLDLLELRPKERRREDKTPHVQGPDPHAAVSRKPTVLLIDDDPDFSRALRIRLRAHGVDALWAFNGMQGYWLALKHRPDVILSDYLMPDGCADYLLARLKAHTLTRDIPVIVVTGRLVQGQHDHGLDRMLRGLGARRILSKPLNFDELLDELQSHIPIQERSVDR